jgi:hypothetical protein
MGLLLHIQGRKCAGFRYLLMIPWTLLGAIVFARPNWIIRMTRAVEEKAERDMERLGKWTPPGFP